MTDSDSPYGVSELERILPDIRAFNALPAEQRRYAMARHAERQWIARQAAEQAMRQYDEGCDG